MDYVLGFKAEAERLQAEGINPGPPLTGEVHLTDFEGDHVAFQAAGDNPEHPNGVYLWIPGIGPMFLPTANFLEKLGKA